MNPGSSTESYPAFARIGLRENSGKNLNQIRDLSGSERAHVAATGRGIAATLEDGGSAPRSHGAARGEVSYAGSIAASGAGRPRRTAARPAPRPPSKDEEGSGSMRPRCNGNSLTRSEGNKIVTEEGERLCPLCREKDSWRHILSQCDETENIRRKYLLPSMLSQNRDSLAYLDLMRNRECEEKTGLFLLKARQLRASSVEVYDAN
ncbi:hypothetical protein ANN_07628 [Periplaneta americana]|uniref:Uncharacterized protein n=1 Tax=Periplaneta americana TaxID=6978 RepID=A0ABQ8T0C3_PERAM|nr:hypothetical protein ANN_07628 [Periplaneta americana]